ncbi:MAG: efflux RND transporter periplasmic adaptor subunit [Paracoccaceae bacterium]
MRWLNFLFGLAFAAAVAAVVIFYGAAQRGDAPAAAAQASPPQKVAVIEANPEVIPVVNELPGRIAPTRIAEVRPRVSGIVIERVFTQGSVVAEGDVLYRIDPEPFQVRVDRAVATLAEAEAARVAAQQTADRQVELKQRNVVSDQQFDTAIAGVARTNAVVAFATAELASAQIDLRHTEVRAPIRGRIGRARITEGALVAANDPESLATIQQLDPVYADFTQPSKVLLALRRAYEAGQLARSNTGEAAVRLKFDDGTEYGAVGKLLFSEATVDATTGQVTLRGEFPNPKGDLLPGMYVRVLIEQGVETDAIAVPQQAVQRDNGGQAQVYIINGEGKAEIRRVTTGRVVGERWVIDEGLSPGDRVIVEGFQKIGPGAPVEGEPWDGAQALETARANPPSAG